MKTFLVGGAVRDLLLDKTPKDKDYVVVGATPEEMKTRGFNQVGAQFPVFLHPVTREEYALARREKKTGVGYHGFSVEFGKDVTLEEDLRRRDLTINAMAMDEKTGQVIDPMNGQKDLQEKILRATSDSFKDDPVRVLRLARFATQMGFTVAEETKLLARAVGEAGELGSLTGERVRLEMEKAFKAAVPSVFFKTLHECGVLEFIFPDLFRLIGVEQPEKWHPEGDAFTHTMIVLDMARRQSNDFGVLVAALTHDLGKGLTDKNLWPAHHDHEKAGVPLVEKFGEWIRLSNDEMKLCLIFARHHLNFHNCRQLRASTLIDIMKEGRMLRSDKFFDNMLICAHADANGKGTETDYPQKNFLRAIRDAINNVPNAAIVDSCKKKADIPVRIREAQVKAVNEKKKELEPK